MDVVRPPTPTYSFANTTGTANHGYFLALRLDEIVSAVDEQATCRLWKLFNSCVNELEQGKRLENLSWRTWSRERTLYSRQHYSRLPLPVLDDETEGHSPLLTEDEGGDSSSSGSDSGSDEILSRQPPPQPPHTTDLAPLPSVTPPITPVTPAPTPVAPPPVVVATAAQSTDSQQQQQQQQQQHTPLVTTPTTTSSPTQPRQRQRQHNNNNHKCSASHPTTGARPKLVAKPRRHYSHSLPHATAAASAAAASASPPIGQLIKTVIFNQSVTMTAMTHDGPQHRPNLNPMPKLHAATTALSVLNKAAVTVADPVPTSPSLSTSHGDRPTLTITESTPLPSVEPTPLPTPKPTGLPPFPYTVPAPLGCPDVQPQASDSHLAPVTTRRALNPSTDQPNSHHRMFYLQYHSPDGSSSGGSHNSHSHLTPSTPGLPASQNAAQMSLSTVEAHHTRLNGTGATRMSARKGKESVRNGHGHVIPRNMSGRMAARGIHHHHIVAGRRAAKSDRSTASTPAPGSASSASRKVAVARRAETVEQRGVDERVGRVSVIGPDLQMQQQQHPVVRHTPQHRLQQQSRSEPGTSTLTTTCPAAAGNANAPSSQTAVQDIQVKNVTGPIMRLITPGLFDGDKVKPEELDQRVDAALKAALNGATGNQRRRIKLVSSSEHESDEDDDDDEGSSWSDDESNEDERHQKPRPTHRSSQPATRKDSQTTGSDDDSDELEHDGPLARAAKEAERQRNMFAKLPRESYADLRRKGIGAGPSNLTLLLNPPPEMFPQEHPYRILSRHSRSAGDIAHHHQDGFGYGYGPQVQRPLQAQAQFQQQQQWAYGQPPQQHAQMQRQQSQPSYGNGTCPPQYAVAPPPQPRQRPVTPVQAQHQHPQQLNTKPPTRERVGGFGGFGFTAMRPADLKASKQPALAAQRPQQVAVAPPPSATAMRRASTGTGTSRVTSTPPAFLRSLSKSSVLDPIIQQVTASSFKEVLPANSVDSTNSVNSANSHVEARLLPRKAALSPHGGRPGNRLSARPDDVDLSDSEDEGSERSVPAPRSVVKNPKSPTREGGGAKAQLEAVMNGNEKSTATATAVTADGKTLVDGPGHEFPESVVPLRAPPSTPSRGTETRVNGEHLPRSPTLHGERPRPHSTYGAPTDDHDSPPPPYPEHAQAGAPRTSDPSSNSDNSAGLMYAQPTEMPYPYNLPFPTHMLSPRTTRLKMLSSEMPPDLRNDLLWERKTNRVHAVYRPMAGLRSLANTAGSGDEGAPREPTEEERAAVAADEARRRAMRNRTWAGVFPRPTAW